MMELGSPIPLPRRRKRIRKSKDWESTSYPFGSTACWRGYIATWCIDEKRLYLKSIYGAVELVGDEPLQATWFTGTLCLIEQNVTIHEYLGYLTRFQPEIILQVEKGEVSVHEEA
jgi:hypothetical protein